MRKIIIDTDPGIDDAMAILFAFAHPEIELIGLTTIFGNVATELATANALRILELTNSTIPVCQGETNAIAGPPQPYPDWVHGKDGLGDINWPAAAQPADQRHAVDFLAETITAQPGEITLVPIGPLTNIARLVTQHPEVVAQVREVVVMGGSAWHPGNVTPLAEANIANDPEGADIVFGANWPVTMVGLDVTANAVVDADDFTKITTANQDYGPFLAQSAGYYIDFYSKHMGVRGCCMHDVCAVALPVNPEIFTVAKARLRVATQGLARGQTAAMAEDFYSTDATWLERPLQGYAAAINHQAMRDLFVTTLSKSALT